MAARVPQIGNMGSLATLSPSFGIPEGCIVKGTFIERPDACAEEAFPTARSCPEEAIASSGYCEIGKAPSESEGSTRSPTTDEGAEIDEYFNSEVMPFECSTLSAAAPAWQWWSDEPDESLSHPTWFAPQACESLPEETWSQWSQPSTSPKTHRDQSGRSPSTPTSLVLRGLPFNATESEVKSFLKQQGVGPNEVLWDGGVVLLTNPQKRPSGFAEIYLAHDVDFWSMHEKLHMQRLGGRYIEVLPPRQARKRTGGGAASKRGKKTSWQ